MSDPIEQAKTKWLQDFLREYLPLVEDLTADTPHWQDQAQQFANKLHETFRERGLTTPSQQKNCRTQVANALRECHPHHPAIPYPYTLLSPETYTELNLEQIDRNEERLTKFFDSTTASAIVDKATELLCSDDPNDLAAALAVLVGRRISEILISRFQSCTAYSLWFSYPVKKGNLTEFCPPYEIPTLIEADKVKAAILSLRETWKIEELKASTTDPIQLKKALNKRYQDVPKAVRRHFSDLVPGRQADNDSGQKLYTHVFRSVYAEIATYFYKPALIPEHQFKAEIQGHFQSDSTGQHKVRSYTARPHYDDYKISDRIPSQDGIKLTQTNVEVLQVFSHAVRVGFKPSSTEDTAFSSQTTTNTAQKVANIEHFCTEKTLVAQVKPPSPNSDPINSINPDFSHWFQAQSQLAIQAYEDKYQAIIEGKDALLAEKEASLSLLQSSLSQKDQLIASLQSLLLKLSPETASELEQQVQLLSDEIEVLKGQLDTVTTQRDESLSKLSQIQSFFDKSLETSSSSSHPPTTPSFEDKMVKAQQGGEQEIEMTRVEMNPESISARDQRNDWVERAIDAIKGYNNDPHRSFKEKWFISNTSLADLLRGSGFKLSNHQISSRRASRSHDIQQHHQYHNLSSRHNAKHDLPISHFISLT